MERIKKLISVLLAAVMVLSLGGVLAGCNGGGEDPTETTGTNDTPSTTASYSVSVKSAGGLALAGVDVYVYADTSLTDLVQYGETNEDGSVSFTMAEGGEYAIVLSGVAAGYEVAEHYAFDGTKASITLTSSLVKDESLSGATLGLGDVMYDFSVVNSEGETVTLSEMLAEKDMVLINFWYTTCTYCVAEFPFMNEAYQMYSEDVGIIALNPLDPEAQIAPFKETYGLTFNMASCPAAWASTFGVSGYPTSIIVDRYGVICLVEAGGITSLRPFISMFDAFTGDDYQQTLYNSLDELVTQIKPNYTMPSSEEIAAIINGEDIQVTYRAEEGDDGEYSWPFIIGEKNGERCIYASNQDIDDSYAILYADVTMEAGQAVALEYLVSTEKSADIMYVIVDDEAIYSISGTADPEKWETCYPWVAEEAGTYEIALCYLKDESGQEGDDTIYIKGLRIVDVDEIDVATYLPRLAASSEDGFDYTYVDIAYNEKDGYYHVGTENGPLLLVNLMMTSNFNEEETIFDMVYAGNVVIDGVNYYDEMVEYFSYASNSSMYGYCPVTQRLYEMLLNVDDVMGFDEEDNMEWLRACQYYQVYGSNEQLGDPIKGLATFSAYEAKLGSNNYFYYDRAIIPRGLLAKFVPTKSGVYRITSSNDSQDGVEGWIFGEGREELYVYEQSERMYNDDNNVSMLFYMEAGTPYYIDIAFWDVYEYGYIYYDIEYVGSTYEVFSLCSPGYFTYDSDATGDAMYYLIAGGVDVVLGEDGIYYEDKGLDANGNQIYGSKIYCDFTGITSLFSNPIASVDYNGNVVKDIEGKTEVVKGMIDMGGFDFSKTEDDLYVISVLEKYDGDVNAADEYLKATWGEDYEGYAEAYQLEDVYNGIYHGTGEDMTEEMRTYLDDVITSGSKERQGCVVVTQRLGEILQMLMDKYTFQNVDHAWTKLCYYYDYLGPEG